MIFINSYGILSVKKIKRKLVRMIVEVKIVRIGVGEDEGINENYE
jgi:hypothetical protein